MTYLNGNQIKCINELWDNEPLSNRNRKVDLRRKFMSLFDGSGKFYPSLSWILRFYPFLEKDEKRLSKKAFSRLIEEHYMWSDLWNDLSPNVRKRTFFMMFANTPESEKEEVLKELHRPTMSKRRIPSATKARRDDHRRVCMAVSKYIQETRTPTNNKFYSQVVGEIKKLGITHPTPKIIDNILLKFRNKKREIKKKN